MMSFSRFRKTLLRLPRLHLALLAGALAVFVTAALLPSERVQAKRIQLQLSGPDTSPETTDLPLTKAATSAPAPDAGAESGAAPDSGKVGDTATDQSDLSAPVTKDQPPVEEWLEVAIRQGDNLTTLFQKAGLGANQLYPFLNALDGATGLERLKPQEHLGFLIDNGQLIGLRHVRSQLESTVYRKTDSGWSREQVVREPEVTHTFKSGTIKDSLFVDGARAGLDDTKIMELAGIFGWDIDFALDIRQGDSFAVIYEELWLDGKKIGDGAILAAEFTNQGKTFQAIRYTDSSGRADYYTPSGDSMRKAFLRTPVDFTRISSRFNPNRKHPIFKTRRPHRGVDYAAPRGTPIKAAGDGKVIFAGTKGGYGKAVILQHGKRYSTLYAHMSRIKPGMKRGRRVNQGQIIGYVGSTGYVTGPHLHYEFRVNGTHRNPLTVKLPQAKPLPPEEMASFRAQAQPLLAQLDSLRRTQLAENR